MKFYELKKGERFKAEFYNQETMELEHTITGTFIKMDGVYGQCVLDGVEYDEDVPFGLYSATMEIERIEG